MKSVEKKIFEKLDHEWLLMNLWLMTKLMFRCILEDLKNLFEKVSFH